MILSLGIPHGNSLISNEGHHFTPSATVINNIAAGCNFRFRAAPCAVPEHSTYYTAAHRVVAAHSFNAGRVG